MGKAEITGLLEEWRRGDPAAAERLFPLVYRELQIVARRQLARHARSNTLVTTALVHEAYVRLVGRSRSPFQDRGHFFAVAARAMRHILVDHARSRGAAKRGGGARQTAFEEGKVPVRERAAELLALDEALTALEELDPRLARVVELRFFGGLSVEEVGESLEISARTVKRDWRKARAFLNHRLSGGEAT